LLLLTSAGGVPAATWSSLMRRSISRFLAMRSESRSAGVISLYGFVIEETKRRTPSSSLARLELRNEANCAGGYFGTKPIAARRELPNEARNAEPLYNVHMKMVFGLSITFWFAVHFVRAQAAGRARMGVAEATHAQMQREL
jgi:hypothetical protein